MARRRQVYEGKAKVLFEGPEPGLLVCYFKDDVVLGEPAGRTTIEGKGVINNRVSEYLMSKLNDIGVPTSFIRRLNMREQLHKEVEIVPLKIVVRNIAAGSLSQRLGIKEGTPLPRSIIEYYYKSDELGDPWVTEEHISAFNWAYPQELDEIVQFSLRVNDFLMGLFLGIGIRLVDLRLEFGRLYENDQVRIVLADEISPDSCRLWDISASSDKPDRERFRWDGGKVEDAYQEVARRLGVLRESEDGGDLKGPKLVR